MLYLTRKIGESVIINETIEVTVVDVRGKSAKLGFTFPPDASVLRRELYERIQEENRAAATAAVPSDADEHGANGNGNATPQADGSQEPDKDGA